MATLDTSRDYGICYGMAAAYSQDGLYYDSQFNQIKGQKGAIPLVTDTPDPAPVVEAAAE